MYVTTTKLIIDLMIVFTAFASTSTSPKTTLNIIICLIRGLVEGKRFNFNNNGSVDPSFKNALLTNSKLLLCSQLDYYNPIHAIYDNLDHVAIS